MSANSKSDIKNRKGKTCLYNFLNEYYFFLQEQSQKMSEGLLTLKKLF